jgi:hypothetical protein
MASADPVSPGTPNVPVIYSVPTTDAALIVARQAQHIANPALPLLGFSNDDAACFRNSIISLLINLPPLSGWIVSDTQGQLVSSNSARLLENAIREYFATNVAGKQTRVDEAIQRWYNNFRLSKPVDPKEIKHRHRDGTQQDAAEVLLDATSDIKAELRSSE